MTPEGCDEGHAQYNPDSGQPVSATSYRRARIIPGLRGRATCQAPGKGALHAAAIRRGLIPLTTDVVRILGP